MPPELMRSENLFNLDHDLFTKNLKCARRGAEGGLSGMTAEHVKPILDNTRDTELFCQVGEYLEGGEIPEDVLHAMRMGRVTALLKASGGVRGIVAGDMVRRLVAKTIAQQIRAPVEVATAPFQHALSTRAGCECVAHALQALTDADPRATILSVDGISAYDSISRVAIERPSTNGRRRRTLAVRESILRFPFNIFDISQGEGGEQGDALMPALFSLGQHSVLEVIQGRLRPSERLMAFLDDIFGKSDPDRSVAVFTAIQEELLRVGIRVHEIWCGPHRSPSVDRSSAGVGPGSNRLAWRCVPSSTARGDGIGDSHGTA